MDDAILLWDTLVAKLIRLQPATMSSFPVSVLAALKQASSNTANSGGGGAINTPPPSTVDELYGWLSRIFTSRLYTSPRDGGSDSLVLMPSKIQEEAISECLLAPTPATVRIAHDIVKCMPRPFQRIWAPAVNACLPLLQDWGSGVTRISGNGGGDGMRLEAIDVPRSYVLVFLFGFFFSLHFSFLMNLLPCVENGLLYKIAINIFVED